MAVDGGEPGVTAFEALVADPDYPMFVVTAAAGGRRAGCMVGSVVEPLAGQVADPGAPQSGFQAVRDLPPGHGA